MKADKQDAMLGFGTRARGRTRNGAQYFARQWGGDLFGCDCPWPKARAQDLRRTCASCANLGVRAQSVGCENPGNRA